MRIIEILLPKGTSDRSLSPQQARKIDALQKRMDSYVDKIMDPNTSVAGKDFLKAKLRNDLEELKDVLPRTVAENTQINELFRSPSDWEWFNTGPYRAVADFEVGDVPYIFSAELLNPKAKAWHISFKAKGDEFSNEYGVLGTGNASHVFSTVLDIMRDFLKVYKGNVNTLKFSADEPSRVKLYSRMIDRLLPNSDVEKTAGGSFVVPVNDPEKEQIAEAVTKLPLSTEDFELVKKFMERPIPAAVAPIYIHQIIEDDEFNDQLVALEDSQPGLDVRPLIAEWFDRVMPDQMYRFTGEVPNHHQKNGTLSIIHGYDSKDYKGTNDPLTGDAYGRF